MLQRLKVCGFCGYMNLVHTKTKQKELKQDHCYCKCAATKEELSLFRFLVIIISQTSLLIQNFKPSIMNSISLYMIFIMRIPLTVKKRQSSRVYLEEFSTTVTRTACFGAVMLVWLMLLARSKYCQDTPASKGLRRAVWWKEFHHQWLLNQYHSKSTRHQTLGVSMSWLLWQ